jgi:predicted regulator of Ras-like GTPase activity (Roadblock/LC7/MglB family)
MSLWQLLFGMPKHEDESARELCEELRHLRHEIRELKETLMIAQTTIDTTLANLAGAVNAAALALAATNPVASTPDTAVQGLIDGVNAQIVVLATATPPPAPPAPPTP